MTDSQYSICADGLKKKGKEDEEKYLKYDQCPESAAETAFGVITFIVLLVMACVFPCCIGSWLPKVRKLGEKCNLAAKVKEYIREKPSGKQLTEAQQMLLKIVLFIFVLVLVTVAETTKLFVNVGMIANSYEFARAGYASAEEHLLSITVSFRVALGPTLSSMWSALAFLTQNFSFDLRLPDDWFCEGYWSAASSVLIIIIAFALAFLIETNIFFLVAIQIRSWGQGSKIKKVFYRVLSGLLTSISIYSLQILVSRYSHAFSFMFSYKYVNGEQRSCGDLDQFLYYATRYVWYVFVLFLFAYLCNTFGGGGLVDRRFWQFWIWIVRWIPTNILCLLYLTIGYWNDLTATRRFNLPGLALRYDDDPEDEDNQHSKVGEIIGKTRTMFWLLFPGGALLTKLGEASNSYIYFMYCDKVDLQHSKYKSVNFIMYLINVVPMVCAIIVALFPMVLTATLAVVIVTPKIFIVAYKQTQEIINAILPHANVVIATGVEMAENASNAARPHVDKLVEEGVQYGMSGMNAMKPHVTKGIEKTDKLVEEGVQYGKSGMNAMKPHVTKGIEKTDKLVEEELDLGGGGGMFGDDDGGDY